MLALWGIQLQDLSQTLKTLCGDGDLAPPAPTRYTSRHWCMPATPPHHDAGPACVVDFSREALGHREKDAHVGCVRNRPILDDDAGDGLGQSWVGHLYPRSATPRITSSLVRRTPSVYTST